MKNLLPESGENKNTAFGRPDQIGDAGLFAVEYSYLTHFTRLGLVDGDCDVSRCVSAHIGKSVTCWLPTEARDSILHRDLIHWEELLSHPENLKVDEGTLDKTGSKIHYSRTETQRLCNRG